MLPKKYEHLLKSPTEDLLVLAVQDGKREDDSFVR